MEHFTANLMLDSDGDVFLVTTDADGDRDFKRLGEIDSCGSRVSSGFDAEFEELEEAWSKWRREDGGCLYAFEAAYARSKGL